MHICDVSLSSADCGSPRTFITIDILETSEPLVHLYVAHIFLSVHILQLCIGLCTGTAKVLAKLYADSLLNILCHGQCHSHTLHTFLSSTAANSGSKLEC